MKYAILLVLAGITIGCATDATGHKVYTGPTLALNLGYNGATIGIGIVGVPAPAKLPTTDGLAK